MIGDEDKRKSYDEVRRLGPMAGGVGGGAGVPAASTWTSVIFSAVCSAGVAAVVAVLAVVLKARRAPISKPIWRSILRTQSTGSRPIHLTSEASCSTCSGTGARPGTTPTACPSCDGRGVQDDNQGFFSMSRPCSTCSGCGSVSPIRVRPVGAVAARCARCQGRIPAGVKSGQKICLKGRGGGAAGGEPGDLFVKVRVKDHPLFGRAGKDLTLDLPVTFDEAALGADISVPTIMGNGPDVARRHPVRQDVPVARQGWCRRPSRHGIDRGPR